MTKNEFISLERELANINGVAKKSWAAAIVEDYTPDEADLAEAEGFIRWSLGDFERRIRSGALAPTPAIAGWMSRARAALSASGTPCVDPLDPIVLLERCKVILETIPAPESDCYTNGLQADINAAMERAKKREGGELKAFEALNFYAYNPPDVVAADGGKIARETIAEINGTRTSFFHADGWNRPLTDAEKSDDAQGAGADAEGTG